MLKNLVEIVAICAAGVWAYYTYVVKEKPGLEHRPKLKNELTWQNDGRGEICQAQFIVNMENGGTTAFDIRKFRIRGWEFSSLRLEGKESARFIDVNEIQKTATPFFEKVYEENNLPQDAVWTPFIGHYPPGITAEQTFDFVVKRAPDKWNLFMIEFYEPTDGNVVKIAAYSWSPVCGDETKKEDRDGPPNE